MVATYSRLATRGFANLKQCSIGLGKDGVPKAGLVAAVVGLERSAYGGTDFSVPGQVVHGWAFGRDRVVVVYFEAGSFRHTGLDFGHVQLSGTVCTQAGIMNISFQLFNFG